MKNTLLCLTLLTASTVGPPLGTSGRRLMRRSWLVLALMIGVSVTLVGCTGLSTPTTASRSSEVALAVPNDNRTPAGTLRSGVLELDLEARPGRWEGEKSDLEPDASSPTIVDVLGFAEEGGPVTIPGPLIRVPQGTEVRIRVRNSIPDSYPIGLPMPGLREEGMSSVADDVLLVRGLRAGTASDDVLEAPGGEVAEVRYRAEVPGTFYYWATPSSRPITAWTGRDAQIAGAITYEMMEAAWRPPAWTGVRPDWMADWMELFARTIDAARSTSCRAPWTGSIGTRSSCAGSGQGCSAAQAGVGQGTVRGRREAPRWRWRSWD